MKNAFFLLLGVAFLLGTTPAQAQENSADMLTITDVAVDKTDKNAVAARDAALMEAKRAAFKMLAERIMPTPGGNGYQAPDDKALATLIQDFEIKNEQMSATRYAAKFTVRFTPDAVSYIRDNIGTLSVSAGTSAAPPPADAPATDAPLKTVLVLPYFKNAQGKTILWEDPNPWREAWQAYGNTSPTQGLTLLVPSGDIADISLGDPQGVWADDFTTLEKLRAAYHADELSLPLARIENDQLRVDIYTYRNGHIAGKRPAAPVALDGPPRTTYHNAVSKLINEIKAAKPLTGGTQPLEKITLDVSMSFDRFSDWVEAQKSLKALSPDLTIDIASISRSAARFRISTNWRGGTESFVQAAGAQGLQLTPGNAGDAAYTLRLATQ